MQVEERLFIGGRWVEPAGSATIDVIGPDTEEPVARVPEASPEDIDRAVAAAREAFDNGPWPRMSPAERADVMAAISAAINARMQEFAETISLTNGSPISWSVMGQVLSSTMTLDFYTQLAREYPFEEKRQGVLTPLIVRKEPVGVVGAIIPWNVPLFTAMLKLGPAFAAGCTVVLKPAPETPLDSYMLARVCEEAGLPPGVLNVVVAGRENGEHLVRHPGVDKIAFTGSTAAGKHIGALCAGSLKRFTLELGGKSAAILLPDANLAEAIPELVPSALMNNGQACVAQTRILTPRDRYSDTVDALVEEFEKQVVGPALDPSTTIGPLVSDRQRERVLGYIDIGLDEGAKVATGGGRPQAQAKGWFVEPTVFVGVDNNMRIAREEIFGPVIAVIAYDTVDEAVAIANDSDYGLSGTVWSADAEKALAIAKRMRTGTVTLNSFLLDMAAPFGGYKQSGIGRELGPEGLEHYLELKSIFTPKGP